MRTEDTQGQCWVTQPARTGNQHIPILEVLTPVPPLTGEPCWKWNHSVAAKAALLKVLTLRHQRAPCEADKTSPERFSAQQMTSVVYDWQHFAMHSFKRNKAGHKCPGFLSMSDAGSFFSSFCGLHW